jgi:hypothetical protein
VGRWTLPAHGTLGLVGFALAVALHLALTRAQGLSLAVAAVLVPVGALTSFGVALGTKVVTGEESHRYLHHEIAFLITFPLTLWLLGEPVLRYLDTVLLGLGTVLGFGRLGCLMAGCCHGKPAGWGVCYRERHVAWGFPPELAFVRLFPVQLLEAGLVLGLVAVGAVLVLSDAAAGTAAGMYVVGYGVIRFALEYLRGDSVRAYWRGFSHVQWTLLAITGATVALEAAGALPFALWHALALAGMVVAMLLTRRSTGLRAAKHVHELAAIVRRVDASPAAEVRVHTSSLGVSVSGGVTERDGVLVRHYSLSHADAALATLVGRLAGAPDGGEIVRGGHGVVHVLVPARE